MKRIVVIVSLLLPTTASAELNSFRLKTLIEICDTAQQSTDLGTVKNIGNQIKNAQRPSDGLLADKYDDCLFAAFGKSEKPLDVDVLIGRIEETAAQIEKDCRELLAAAPSVAVSNTVCKGLLLK